MSRKYLSTANLVLKVLGDNWLEKLTLEEIRKKVAKEVGKETIDDYMITRNDATELKRILDDLRQDKYVNIFDLDDGTKTKYQITREGRGMHEKILKERLVSITRRFMYQRDPLQDERDKLAQAKKAEEKRVYGTPQEKRAYYSSQTYLSREEYKKNKKYINKKEWQQNVIDGVPSTMMGYSRKSYSPRARLERKRDRRDWYFIFACMAIPIIIAIVVIILI